MGSAEKFCLRWNDFESNVSQSFQDLRLSGDFFDVSLVTDDESSLDAHKVILSACSPFFRKILSRQAKMSKHPHPVIYLRGISIQDLGHVMDFIYHGAVNVAQDSLEDFLKVAEALKIKGLTQSNEGGGGVKSERSPTPANSLKRSQQQSTPSSSSSEPRKKMKMSSQQTPSTPVQVKQSANQDDDDDDVEIQEVTPHLEMPDVKSEPSTSSAGVSGTGAGLIDDGDGGGAGYPGEEYGDYGEGYDESGDMSYEAGPGEGGSGKGKDTQSHAVIEVIVLRYHQLFCVDVVFLESWWSRIVFAFAIGPDHRCRSLVDARFQVGDVDALIQENVETTHNGVLCMLCQNGKLLQTKSIRQHFLAKHIVSQIFKCPGCQKYFKGRNSFGSHMSRKHRELKGLILDHFVVTVPEN